MNVKNWYFIYRNLFDGEEIDIGTANVVDPDPRWFCSVGF